MQGNERDVIIFSVAVGPDKNGRITAQISSPNNEGGHRRLNVAVTRARRELLVFPTLRPEPPASTSVIAGKADSLCSASYSGCAQPDVARPRAGTVVSSAKRDGTVQ